MTFIEAIKSGRPFRRKIWDDDSMWLHVSANNRDGIEAVQFIEGINNAFSAHVEDITADDWELKETAKEVTRSQIITGRN